MASRRILVLGTVLVIVGGGYLLLRPAPIVSISGVVRATQVRIAPEVGGQLAAYVERPRGARDFFRRFIQLERCGHMYGLSARSMTAGLDEVRDARG